MSAITAFLLARDRVQEAEQRHTATWQERRSGLFFSRMSAAAGPAQTLQMTRSSGKSSYQGKPHLGSSETWDAGCWFVVPKSSRLQLLLTTRKSAHLPVRSFPGRLGRPNPVSFEDGPVRRGRVPGPGRPPKTGSSRLGSGARRREPTRAMRGALRYS